MRAISVLSVIAVSIIYSSTVQAEPIEFFDPSQFHVVAMGTDTIDVQIIKANGNPLTVRISPEALVFLNIARASARGLKERVGIDIGHLRGGSLNPSFYVGGKNGSLAQGWLVVVDFVKSLSEGNRVSYVFEDDGSRIVLYEHNKGEESALVEALHNHKSDGFLRFRGTQQHFLVDVDFMSFSELALFKTGVDNRYFAGVVAQKGDKEVQLLLADTLKYAYTGRQVLCLRQQTLAGRRPLITQFWWVGPEFILPGEEAFVEPSGEQSFESDDELVFAGGYSDFLAVEDLSPFT
jgi:hypothetical protein